MKELKSVGDVVNFLLGLVVLYFIGSMIWSVIDMQSCGYDLPENPTCEQIAQNNSDNCRYVFLKWKTVDYEEELQECTEWEQKNR